MLEFENVSKSFWTGTQRKVILEQVSFRVELGRSLIISPSISPRPTPRGCGTFSPPKPLLT